MIIPKLRFPEFFDEYVSFELSKLVQRVRRKNSNNETDIPLTIASIEGLVDQRTYFGKTIASKNMSGYILLKKGEFAYNKSYSKGFPVGSIKRLDNYEQGALSTLYICFYLESEDIVISDYMKQYFESSCWYKAVKDICAEGARNHGLLNVSSNDFFDTVHNIAPTRQEQKKIAEFLFKYDEKIKAQTTKITALEERKKGILQQIFSQKIRFKSDDGSNFPDWKEQLLSDVLIERKEKSSQKEEVYSVSVSKGLVNQIEHLGRSYAAEDTSKYKIIRPGDIVYTKSPTGEFKWGIVKQSMIDKTVIVSPLYGIFIPKSEAFGFVLDSYFSSSVRAHNYLITQIRKGAKNTINITNDVFLEKKISLPTSEKECIKIKQFVMLLDKQIQLERDKLEAINKIKKGLLQQMFV